MKTKAAVCITSSNLLKFLPDSCIKIDVKNVLFAVTKVSKMFNPNADVDLPDEKLNKADNLKKLSSSIKKTLRNINYKLCFVDGSETKNTVNSINELQVEILKLGIDSSENGRNTPENGPKRSENGPKTIQNWP